MARSANPAKPLEVTLSLHERTGWYLDRLMEKGLYGNSRAQVAATLIYDHCKALIGQGRLEEAPALIAGQGKSDQIDK